MPDMLVKLYDLPEDAQTACPRDESVQIRRAMAPDKFRVVEWVKEHSGLSAAGECDVCFARPAVSCFIATRGKKILGYACYDATAPDFFGPTRVLDEEQGGGIGRALAPRLAAFGATVVASDVFWPEDFAQEHGIRRVNLDELFAVSDIITLHCPLMDATRGLVDAARLASMKPGAILVNAARGGIVDETALAAALERGVIRGAAIDNFESVNPSPGNPLLRLSPEARRRVLFSPHLAGVTRAAFARLIRQAIGNLENSLRGLPPQFSVNGLSSIRPSA